MNPAATARFRLSRVEQSKRTRRFELLLVLLVLVYSGNPVLGIVLPMEPMMVSLAVFLAGLMVIHRRLRITIRDFTVMAGLFGVILFVQCVEFSFYPVVTICGFLTRLFIGYAVVRLVTNFPLLYVRAMFYLGILSLMFHIPCFVLGFAGHDPLPMLTALGELMGTGKPWSVPIFFHTFILAQLDRNAGVFWEPGALAGYLTLALIFLWIIKRQISARDYWRYLIVLSAVLLSTISTTGYVAYPLVLVLHHGWRAKERGRLIGGALLAVYVFLPLLIMVSMYVYRKAPFLQTKIEHQFYEAKAQENPGWHQARVGSLVFDWEYIRRRPLTGWGLHENTRYALHPHFIGVPQGMGNGMSDFMADFGVTGMLVWVTAVYSGLFKLTKGNRVKSLFIIFILVLLLQGEAFLGFPLFLGLMFLGRRQTVSQKMRLPTMPVQRQIGRRLCFQGRQIRA